MLTKKEIREMVEKNKVEIQPSEMMFDPSIIVKPITEIPTEPTLPKVETLPAVDHGFFRELPIVKKESAKKESEIAVAKPEPINHIKLGEITSDVLGSIIYPCIVRARFTEIGLNINYRIKQDDGIKSTLSTLRDAIFAAQYNRDLPKRCFIDGAKSHNAGVAFALQGSISTQVDMPGIIDAVIEVFECEID